MRAKGLEEALAEARAQRGGLENYKQVLPHIKLLIDKQLLLSSHFAGLC